ELLAHDAQCFRRVASDEDRLAVGEQVADQIRDRVALAGARRTLHEHRAGLVEASDRRRAPEASGRGELLQIAEHPLDPSPGDIDVVADEGHAGQRAYTTPRRRFAVAWCSVAAVSWADLDRLSVAKPRADGATTLVVRDDRTLDQMLDAKHLSIVVAI